MISVSSAWEDALANDNRDYIEKVRIVFADNTTLEIGNEDIWNGGFSIEDAVSAEDSLQIGTAIINKFTLCINNIYGNYDNYIFEDAVLTVWVGLVTTDSTEMIQKGRYTVNSAAYNGDLITLECYDFMQKFDKAYDNTVSITYPATLYTIVRILCITCGVPLATPTFQNWSYSVSESPDKDTSTCREVLSWVAQIAGCFARINPSGNLELKWFSRPGIPESSVTNLDGGEFDSSSPYSTGDEANGGTFNPWNTGNSYIGGTFNWSDDIYKITSIYSEEVSVDEVIITGVRILVKTQNDSETASEEIAAFLSGVEGYIVEISDNPFITVSNAQEIADWIGSRIIGFAFRKANISHGSNPAIEAGDVAAVYDRKGNIFPIVVSKTVFTVGSPQTTISGAQTPMRNSAARYSVLTKNYVEMRKRLQDEATTRELMQADLAQRIASANGLYQTDITTTGGAVKHYLHNKTELNESDIQILVSDVGVTMTANGTDAQPTWYGLTVDGTLIASILSVDGINADWINSGHINASYIQSGTLKLGGTDNKNGILKVVDAQNRDTVLMNCNETDYYGYLDNFTTTPEYKLALRGGKIFGFQYVSGVLQDVIVFNSPKYASRTTQGVISIGNAGTALGLLIDQNTNIFLNKSDQTTYVSGLSKNVSYKIGVNGNVLFESNDGVLVIKSTYNESFIYKLRTYDMYTTSFSCSGTKSRQVSTKDYADRLLYCYETPSPMFGDVGEGVIGEDGKCYVTIDPVFAETVSLNQYQVFLQKYGAGDCYVSERKSSYFVVEGTLNMAFGWEIKAKQSDFDQLRLDRDEEAVSTENAVDYVAQAEEHINELMKERGITE